MIYLREIPGFTAAIYGGSIIQITAGGDDHDEMTIKFKKYNGKMSNQLILNHQIPPITTTTLAIPSLNMDNNITTSSITPYAPSTYIPSPNNNMNPQTLTTPIKFKIPI